MRRNVTTTVAVIALKGLIVSRKQKARRPAIGPCHRQVFRIVVLHRTRAAMITAFDPRPLRKRLSALVHGNIEEDSSQNPRSPRTIEVIRARSFAAAHSFQPRRTDTGLNRVTPHRTHNQNVFRSIRWPCVLVVFEDLAG